MSELHDRFVAAVQPLTELVGELDAEIDRLVQELGELRELRRNVKAVVERLDPKPKPKPRPKAKASIDLDKKNRVLAHLSSAGYTPERDITAPGLKENGLGDPPISLGLLYGILDDLRDDGFLRVDRIGKGGQKIYRTVAL